MMLGSNNLPAPPVLSSPTKCRAYQLAGGTEPFQEGWGVLASDVVMMPLQMSSAHLTVPLVRCHVVSLLYRSLTHFEKSNMKIKRFN